MLLILLNMFYVFTKKNVKFSFVDQKYVFETKYSENCTKYIFKLAIRLMFFKLP